MAAHCLIPFPRQNIRLNLLFVAGDFQEDWACCFFKEDGKSDLMHEMRNYFFPLKWSTLLILRSDSGNRNMF